MRDKTLDSTDIRWEVLKSMLDDFPQLRDRTEQYLLGNKNSTKISSTRNIDPEVRKLMQKAVNEYRQERPRK